MKQDRSLLEQNLIKPTLEIKRKRKVVADIKKYLVDKYSLFEGSIQSWINNPGVELKSIDTRLLCLFAEQIYEKTKIPEINPELFFTDAEMRKSKQFTGKLMIENEIKFPLHFENALEVSRDSWVVMMDIHTIVGLLKSRKLNWNPESQREATYKVLNGEIVQEATLYMPNVITMKNLLKEGKLERTKLIFNASLGTSNEAQEVIYNQQTGELIITDGTVLDICDGYHRVKASELALGESPDIEHYFQVEILNFTVDRAAQYLEQISRGVPISETKKKIMRKDTELDILMKDLIDKSILRNRISQKEGLTKKRKELVTYNTLSNSIEKYFNLDRKIDRVKVTNYLMEFFEALLSFYENEFTNEYDKYKKESLINDNNIVGNGFIVLASKLYENNIDPWNVNKYIKDINFSRMNSMWRELGILDEKGSLTKNAKQNIEKYFKELEINVGV